MAYISAARSTWFKHSKNLKGITKGQLISEWNFGVFKSPKKPTKFLTDFCPSRNLSKIWLFFGEIWRHQNFILRLTDLYTLYSAIYLSEICPRRTVQLTFFLRQMALQVVLATGRFLSKGMGKKRSEIDSLPLLGWIWTKTESFQHQCHCLPQQAPRM